MTRCRIIASALLAAAALGVVAPAAEAHGTTSETYTAEAPAPFPSFAGCTGGQEGVNKESHSFQVPVAGTLAVTMSEFTGDWDLYLLNSTGGTIDSSTLGQPENPSLETVGAQLAANEAVTIVACNWSGGPVATVNFTFDGVGIVSVGDATVHEGDDGTRKASFAVTLSEPSDSTVTVSYATVSNDATAPADYALTSGRVTFLPGTTKAFVKVTVAGERLDEGDETFTLRLSSPAGAFIGDGTGTGTILDDDPSATTGPRVAVGDVAVHEGNAGARAAAFTVSLSEASGSYVTVAFATAKGTATGTDFTAKSGKLSFAPGTTSLIVKVAITPDSIVEGNESFVVKLSNASGATIADVAGEGTIIDND